MACGTGFAARAAARRLAGAGRVVGVDVNPGMLFIPKEASPGLDIAWLCAAAEEIFSQISPTDREVPQR